MMFKKLLFRPVFFFFFFLILASKVLLVSSSVKLPIRNHVKPGCLSRCGNVEISYPFGIGPNCSLDKYFDLYCNTLSNFPKLYLQIPNFLEVVSFSADQPQIHVKNWTEQWATACHDDNSMQYMRHISFITFYFKDNPYTLSDANQVTAFGCDDMVMVQQFSNLTHTDGGYACLPYCQSSSDRVGSCPGQGCCRTSISKTDYLNIRMVDMHSNWDLRSKSHVCSFAFVGQNSIGNFSFNLSHLDDLILFQDNIYKQLIDNPLVLDWRIISSSNCITINSTAPTICKKNSFCIDSDASLGGYLCKCNHGYEGNPYLSPGCQDINECDSNNNPCAKHGICINTPGSYHCSCDQGYYGDGRKNGSGCTPVPTYSGSKVAIGVGLGTGIGTLILLLACFWLYKFQKKRKSQKRREKFFKQNGHFLQQEGILETTQIFTAKELEKATDRFNTSRVLGTGGQGTVYKGMLSNGKIVAIKKSNSVDEKHVQLFINEVVILSQINHRNIVKLLGCCLETQVPLLVYEFVSNGTLYDHIYEENNEFPLTWNLRLKIATAVAGALAYLHSATCHSIYHRDIKLGNILLVEKYVPKVSDFGISLSVQEDQTHVTTRVMGTFGYIVPQYFQLRQFTEKSDDYSFGVVLVELLTAQRPTRVIGQEDIGLAARFLQCMEGGNLETILDPHVKERVAGKKEELVDVAEHAQRCLNLNGKERPTMKEVVITLESIRMSQASLVLGSLVETKLERKHLLKPILTSDEDYTRASTSNITIPSSDVCPLKVHTV